ncbi:hypothetical protein BEN30_13450 [Magnetovibrio blakemorei]|uniref:DUF4114 domain-containing protein n=1 Tax=Magnetovibrio blakemorei TaxID=28181 RepID=A0A1E5Q5X3_9PROT|nr:hypothetical protein BEN30_13450 [Magnetovibrio blakemorei]
MDGETLANVVISGVPSGATLSLGTDNGDGSWTISGDELSGLSNLTMTPDLNYSGTPTLGVTALTSEGGTVTVNAPLTVVAVADAPTLTLSLGDPSEVAGFLPDIAEMDHDISNIVMYLDDGSGNISKVKVEDFPGHGLDDVNDLGIQEFLNENYPDSTLVGLTVKAGDNHTPGFGPGEGEMVYVQPGMTVSDLPVAAHADTTFAYGDSLEGLEPSSIGGDGDMVYPVEITTALTDTDGSEELSVVVSGVPTGVTLSAGTDNGDGTWSVATGDLSGLTMTVPAGTDGFNLSVTSTSTELSNDDSASASATVAVGDVAADLNPSVDSINATGNEDTTIALDITVSNADAVTITHISNGTLSAGTDNGDGTWTLTPAQLDGLTFTPDQDWSGSFDIGVTATSADGDAASATSTVNVIPVADDATVSGTASGAEDTAIALDITAAVGDTDGSEAITQFTITGMPEGATLSAGTHNQDGSWTLSPAQLEGLTITPPSDYSGNFELGITAQVVDTAGNLTDSSTATGTIGVDVTPVADAPELSTTGATGNEDSAIPLNISTAETDTDGSEVISITITGVPTGAQLSAGTDNGNGTWTLSPEQLTDLAITPPADYNGTFELGVVSTSTDTLGNVSDSATSTSSLTVTVAPVGDTPGISIVGGGSGDEDTQIPIGIVVTPVGGETLANLVISGVPSGASLSLGTDNGDGSWTISGDELESISSLTMTPELHYSGTPTLSVTAETNEGGTVTVNAPVAVVAVADAPTLDVSIGEGVTTDAMGSLTLENVGQASAGYENTIGWYRMDENGEPVEGGVIWADAKQDVGDSFTLDGVDPSTIGFFLLSDGGTQNPNLANGEAVTFQQDGSGHWQAVDSNGTVLTAESGGGLFFTNPTLNADGYDHEADSGAIGNMNWEDLVSGGDHDFNDVNLNLTTQAGNGEATTAFDLDITSNLVDQDGSETLSLLVAGVPEGATLSAGTDNGDGTWSLTPAQLTDLQIITTGDVTADFDLTVTATATEPNGDTASVSQTVGVDVPDVVIPTVTFEAGASGDEDTAIALNITATDAASVNISGLPEGATLSVGTDNGDGSWTVTPEQLDGLTMMPGENYSGTSDMTVTVTSSSGDTASTTSNVEVVAVADAPTLSVSVGEGVSTEVGTGAGETLASEDFTDGVSGWSGCISGENGGMSIDYNDTATKTFDFGAENAGQTVTVSFDIDSYGSWDTSGWSQDYFTVAANGESVISTSDNSANLSFTATLDENGQLKIDMAVDATASDEGILLDNFQIVSGDDWGGTETTVFDLDITSNLVDTDGSETLSITVDGIPEGASLSAGTDNGDGTWTLTPAQLSGLQITTTDAVTADFNLTVTATTTEPNGDTASISQTVSVDASDVEIPTVTFEAGASGDEDMVIPLNIMATNAVSINISGLPQGATLSAGTDNGDGSWTVTPEQLDGLSMTPGENYSGASDMTVTATSSSGDTASITSSVEVVAIADAPTLNVSLGNGVTISGGEEVDVSINANNMKDTDSGFTVSARSVDGNGNLSEPSADKLTVNANPSGFGVANGVGSGDAAELGYAGNGVSEQIIVDFNGDVSSVAVEFAWLHSSETAEYEIYRDGVLVGQGTVDGITDAIDPAVHFTATDGGTFDQIVFSAPGSGDDYLIHSITTTLTEPGETVTEFPLTISSNLFDTDGSETLSLVVGGVPAGATLSAGTDNGDGTWTLTPAQLGDLTVTVPSTVSADFDLNVTATATEPNGDTASVSQSVSVLVSDLAAEAPTLTTAIGEAEVTEGVAATTDLDYDNINFGAGAGADAGSDEKEDYLSKYDDEWVGNYKDNDVDGGSGSDVLAGKGGADEIEGGSGNDLLFGGAGADNLEGDDGNDILFGGSGNNVLSGGSGDDFIIGGSGNDVISGGDGNDVIFAGGGYNKVDGGSGNDVMVFTGVRADYLFTEMDDGQYVVEHLDGGADGVSLVENIETFQFMDGQYGVDDMSATNPEDGMLLTYDITIETGLTDTDGSETLSDVTISGVPDGSAFSAGTDNGDGSWTFGQNDLNGLTLQVDQSVGDDFSLNVSVTSTEANGDTATSTSTIEVVLPEDVGGSDIVGDTTADALDPLAAMFDDSDTLTFGGEQYDISSLTDGDTADNYGGLSPMGAKVEQEGYDPADNDTSDGYSSTDTGADGVGPDFDN